jgi:predicted Zn-dependent protease
MDIPDEQYLRWYLVKSIEYDKDKLYDVLTLVDSDGRFVKVTAVDVYEKRVRFVQSHEWDDMSDIAASSIVQKLKII